MKKRRVVLLIQGFDMAYLTSSTGYSVHRCSLNKETKKFNKFCIPYL